MHVIHYCYFTGKINAFSSLRSYSSNTLIFVFKIKQTYNNAILSLSVFIICIKICVHLYRHECWQVTSSNLTIDIQDLRVNYPVHRPGIFFYLKCTNVIYLFLYLFIASHLLNDCITISFADTFEALRVACGCQSLHHHHHQVIYKQTYKSLHMWVI